jgi:hypothetical protein
VVRARRGRRDGSDRVLCGLSQGRPQSTGLRAGDDGRAVVVRLLSRCAVGARDRAGLRGERRLPRDRGAGQARSRNDRPLRRASRAGAGGAVWRGARALRAGGPGQGRDRRDRWHQGSGERQSRRHARLRADRARDHRGSQGGRRGRGRALRRGARRRAAARAGQRPGSQEVAARLAAPSGRPARRGGAPDPALTPRAAEGGQASP